jgi:hypothetical protein
MNFPGFLITSKKKSIFNSDLYTQGYDFNYKIKQIKVTVNVKAGQWVIALHRQVFGHSIIYWARSGVPIKS